jgi:hypothetical protein
MLCFSVILLWRHNRKQIRFRWVTESIFSSTPDLSFIFTSRPDLSILFTSEVLFLEYFELYQNSMHVVSSNQILEILEVFNNIIYRNIWWSFISRCCVFFPTLRRSGRAHWNILFISPGACLFIKSMLCQDISLQVRILQACVILLHVIISLNVMKSG